VINVTNLGKLGHYDVSGPLMDGDLAKAIPQDATHLRLRSEVGYGLSDFSFASNLSIEAISIIQADPIDLSAVGRHLSFISSLHLSGPYIGDLEFGSMRCLKEVGFAYDKGFASIGEAPVLQHVHIQSAGTRGLDLIARIPYRLKSVDIGEGKFLDGLDLESLSELSGIRLRKCKLSSSHFHRIFSPKLKTLYIQSTPIMELTELYLSSVRSIRIVIIEDCGPAQTLAPLADHPVEYLFLIGRMDVRDGKIRRFADVPTLRDTIFVDRPHYDIKCDVLLNLIAARHGAKRPAPPSESWDLPLPV
jgi:hypothetical protein